MDKDMKKEFLEMLKEEMDSQVGWTIVMSMVSMVENDERMDYLAELHRGIHEYDNYLTEKEAKRIVDGFIAFDGSRGQHWSLDAISDELRKAGGVLEEKHHFNKWMLYALMNGEWADYGGVLMKLGLPPQEIPRAIYLMAIAKLNDKDRKMSMRQYYGLE